MTKKSDACESDIGPAGSTYFRYSNKVAKYHRKAQYEHGGR